MNNTLNDTKFDAIKVDVMKNAIAFLLTLVGLKFAEFVGVKVKAGWNSITPSLGNLL